jgi:hypothetical protein
MKKKATSQSAFFNLRLLVGLFVALVGVSLLALGALATANPAGRGAPAGTNAPASPNKYKVTTKSSIDPLVPAMFDCSKIRQLGINKQENMRAGAIMIHCGQAKGGDSDKGVANSSAFSKVVQNLTAPLVYGGTDVDLITGTETSPNITQSETFTAANPDDPNVIGVAYNDSRGRNFNPINISGASFSTDGGITFTRLTPSPFVNTFGDPVLLYNKPTQTWFTVWLDGGCGGQGLAGISPALPGTRIAGPISAPSSRVRQTASLAGLIITPVLPSSAGCTFPGTTSMLVAALFSSPSPVITAPRGTVRYR